MALQIWLPLNNSLNNQGIYSLSSITSAGTSANANGKIGSCMKITGQKDLGYIPNFNTNEISICGWFKFNKNEIASVVSALTYTSAANSPTGNLVGNDSYGGIGIIWYGNNYYTAQELTQLYILGALRTPTVNLNTGGMAIDFDVWTHIAITWNLKTKRVSLYKNGVFNRESTVASNFSDGLTNRQLYINYNAVYGGNGPSTTIPFYANDIRVYDHCLSSNEIKDISKGLVLHYKLNDVVNTNLFQTTPKYYSPTAYNAYQLQMTENLQSGQTYTIQLWDVDVSHSNKTESQLGISLYWGGGSVGLKTCNGTSYFTNGHADYITFSITPTAQQASGSGAANAWINVYNSVSYVEGTMNMHIGAWKLEKGNVATSLYGSSTEQLDCSGYGNNGTISGTLTTTSDSPRYNGSTLAEDTSSYSIITHNNLNLTDGPTTISFWSKPTISATEDSSKIDITFSNCHYFTYINYTYFVHNGDYKYRYVNPWLDNNWHFITCVFDGTNTKIYVDGSIIDVSTTSSSDATVFKSNLDIKIRGNNISDFRIYATALSDNDIKELYDTSAYIYNNGTLATYEYVEENTQPLVMKNGMVKCNSFSNSSLSIENTSGATWVLLLDHNNPAQNLFTQENCWNNNAPNLFSALGLLKYGNWANSNGEYEFLVRETSTSTQETEAVYRWKQTSNPATSSTLSGYQLISGSPPRSCGLMNKNSYGAFHNGASWWCCCGSYTDYGGGIPGFSDKITSGRLRFYIRIPDVSTIYEDNVIFFKDNIQNNNLIEI